MSNDLPNCGVVDQFHNDLLVERLTQQQHPHAAGHVAADWT